jgi:hypothetical protein
MRRPLAIATAVFLVAVAAAADVRLSDDDGANHSYPAVCRQPDGFVAVWESDGADGREVTVQRLDDDGDPTGAAFRANQENTGDQQLPDVACRADGSFLVVWESRDQDGDGLGIFARDFAADGTPNGGEFQVNTHTADNQRLPRISICEDGGGIVAWQSFGQDGDGYGIYSRRFGPDAAVIGGELSVNETTSGDQSEADVACGSTGPVVVWRSRPGNAAAHLMARLPDEIDTEYAFLAELFPAARHPSVTALPDGAFAVAFEIEDANDVVLAVVYDPPTTLSTLAAGSSQRNEAPAIGASGNGRVVVAWGRGAGFDFDLAGMRVAPFFTNDRRTTLNAERTGNDGAISTLGRGVAIATAPDGDLVVWQKRDVFADDSSSAIYARRFRDCIGDCSDDGVVAINELITGVRIALNEAAVDICSRLDANASGAVEINELIRAVNEALARICPAPVN